MSDSSPVYMIAQLDLSSIEQFFADYAMPLGPIHERHGVEVVVGTPEATVVEGDYAANLTVVLKFPSAEAQQAWYDDPDYQPLKAVRQGLSNADTSTIIVAPSFVPPAG